MKKLAKKSLIFVLVSALFISFGGTETKANELIQEEAEYPVLHNSISNDLDISDLLYGDLNGDGDVNSLDLALMKKYLLNTTTKFPSDKGLTAADLNRDEEVNSIDYAILRKYLLGKIPSLPLIKNTEFVQILLRYRRAGAVRSDGTLWTWGYNGSGQLGYETERDFCSIATKVAIDDVKSIAFGERHTVALKNDGTVWTWGSNWYGQLGVGATYEESTPVQVEISGVKAIAAQYYTTFALKEDGTVWAWGANQFGQLGNGSTDDSFVPTQVQGLSGVKEISTGKDHIIALKDDGTVWAWGYNYGSLGDGTYTNRSVPVKMEIDGVKKIVASHFASYMFKEDGTLWACGCFYNESSMSSIPVQLDITEVTELFTTPYVSSTIALKKDGTVWGWGYNKYGQLGTGNTGYPNEPMQVQEIDGVKKADLSVDHIVFLKEDGTVWVCGYNYYSVFGNGTQEDSYIPVKAEISGVKDITTDDYSVIAVKEDGTVWAWGINWNGQLGNGTTTRSDLPVQVIFED